MEAHDLIFETPRDVYLRHQKELFTLIDHQPKLFVLVCEAYINSRIDPWDREFCALHPMNYKDKLYHDEEVHRRLSVRRQSKTSREKPKSSSVNLSFILSARDVRKGNFGRTLVHACAANSATELLVYVLKLGCPVDAIDSVSSRLTPYLENALRIFPSLDVLGILVNYGADICAVDVNGDSALHFLARTGNIRMISLFLGNLLKLARSKGSQDMIRLSNMFAIKNIKGKLPEDVARDASCRDFIRDQRQVILSSNLSNHENSAFTTQEYKQRLPTLPSSKVRFKYS